jgi:hypothetical protein
MRARAASSRDTESGSVRSTPRSYTASRWDGLRSSQTTVRAEPPTIIVRILVGDSQLTCTWAMAPVDSRTVR